MATENLRFIDDVPLKVKVSIYRGFDYWRVS